MLTYTPYYANLSTMRPPIIYLSSLSNSIPLNVTWPLILHQSEWDLTLDLNLSLIKILKLRVKGHRIRII